MIERWRRSWYFWVGIIWEVFGQEQIGRDSSVFLLITIGIIAVLELYILLKLPYSEKLWLYEESSNNPKCSQTRWIGLLPILVWSYFTRTTLWYFWIYFPLTETATLYLAGTEEEKNKVRADVFRNVKSATTVVIIVAIILIAYAYERSQYMHTMMNSIFANTSHHQHAQPSH